MLGGATVVVGETVIGDMQVLDEIDILITVGWGIERFGHGIILYSINNGGGGNTAGAGKK